MLLNGNNNAIKSSFTALARVSAVCFRPIASAPHPRRTDVPGLSTARCSREFKNAPSFQHLPSRVCVCVREILLHQTVSVWLFLQNRGDVCADRGLFLGGRGRRPREEDSYPRKINLRLCDRRARAEGSLHYCAPACPRDSGQVWCVGSELWSAALPWRWM